ncbi:MAG: hypothetical protein QOK21_3271 [Solirubrobacteraceae bacterium]|nr:hypothetical protein [Solirubrobacteraceae bacterium]
MPSTLTIAGVLTSSLDVLLDAASESGARLTWGRTWLTRRHWVAVELLDGQRCVRRGGTRAEAARRLLHDFYGGARPMTAPIPER